MGALTPDFGGAQREMLFRGEATRLGEIPPAGTGSLSRRDGLSECLALA